MMNRLHHRKNWSHSEAQISTALSADSYHLVLETAPPDYVEKISRYLASSVGHSKRDPESTDSDSGDSLFITQNKVPEAVRSQRRCHSTQRSEEPTSHTELEDSEDSCREDGKEGRRKKQKLPIYSFPFHKKRERKDRSAELSVQDNIKIHYAGMGGFFHSVKELWHSYQDGDNLESSLPTVDMDGEEITPLSEEGERSDHEDIKVVEKNRFVVSCKAKRRQIWKAPQKRDNQMEQQRKRRRGSNATQETSPRKQRTDLYKTTTPKSMEMVSSSDSDSMDNGESSHRVQAERRRSNKLLKSRRKIVYQTPPPSSSTNSQKVKKAKLRDDSDATKQAERMQQDREISSTTVTADVCHMLDLTETEHPEDEPGAGESQDLPQRPPHLIKDSDGNESSIKKRKKKKEKHGDEDKETEAQQAVTSEDVVMADAESPAPQAADEPELNENNQTENSLRDDGDTLREEDGEIERELPLLKQKKKKRKKNKAAVENSEQEDEAGHLECHVRVEEEQKKKKKKRERNDEDEEDVEQLSSGTVAESLNDAETLKQKKKRKKEKSLVNTEVLNSTLDQVEEHESCLESNAASQETLDSSYVKKKKKKQSCLDATEAGGEDDAGDVSMSNDAATPAGKKKKKKKRKGSGECEEDSEQLSSSAVTEPDAEIPKKKKKKSLVNREEVLNSTVDQVEEQESCLESNAASQETLESSYVKKKKKQKKKKQSCLDATEAGGEEVVGDVSMSNDAATPAGKKKKKKKISICDGTDVSLEETTGDKDAELVSKKKKKKKKKEILSINMSEDTEAQSHDSVSVREKEKKKKKKASSFLAADAEGNGAQTHQDKSFPSQSVAVSAGDFEAESAETAENVSVTEFNGEVRKKKKKKKKTSDKDSERNFEEQNETSQSDLPETTDVTVKRKKKRRREESESVTPPESAADVGCLEIDEAVVVKKKKKKKIKRDSSSVIEDAESEISTQTSHKKQQTSSPLDPKSKHSAESSHDNRKSEQDTKDTHLDVPGNDVTPKKKKKKSSSNVLPEGKSVVKAVEVEPQKERNKTSASPRVISSSSDSPSCFKMSSSDSIKTKEHIKAKKTLYNPSESFLT